MKYLAGPIIFLGSLIAGFISLAKAGGIPERVPVHWNLAGQVDRYGSKWEGLLFVPIFMLVLATVFALIGVVAGKRLRPNTVRALNIVSAALVAFMVAIHSLILSGNPQGIPAMMPAFLTGLLMVLGFAIKGVEPNPFVGIRVPWTMNSPTTWRKTHDRASKLWIFGGLLGLILSAVGVSLVIPILIFTFALLYPILDSYMISKSS